MWVTRRCRITVDGWVGNSINLQHLSGRQAGRLSLGSIDRNTSYAVPGQGSDHRRTNPPKMSERLTANLLVARFLKSNGYVEVQSPPALTPRAGAPS
jgi:hypothetical protein